jgi:hypothetical protein
MEAHFRDWAKRMTKNDGSLTVITSDDDPRAQMRETFTYSGGMSPQELERFFINPWLTGYRRRHPGPLTCQIQIKEGSDRAVLCMYTNR